LFHEPSREHERLFLYLFIGHFVKDFYVSSMTKEYVAHHMLAIGLAMRFLWEGNSTLFCLLLLLATLEMESKWLKL
jgi:hypothetical protein